MKQGAAVPSVIIPEWHTSYLEGRCLTARDCLFALYDDNVIYEIYLKDAINRDLLAPFRYYGIYDDTDYTQVE